MRWLTLIPILLMAFSPMAIAQEPLATDLSEDAVAITSDFNGKDLLLFGSTGDRRIATKSAEPVDVVIVVHGPEVPMKIWRKERVAGVWVNSQPVTFVNVPGYYVVATNRPLTDITSQEYLRRENIGADNLVLVSVEDVSLDEKTELRKAILGNRGEAGLYQLNEDAVSFPDGRLFRSSIHFPSNVPVGDYRVIVRLFQNGMELDRSRSIVTVGKQGIEQQIFSLAQDYSFFYGLGSVTIAMLAGWLASVAFRRN